MARLTTTRRYSFQSVHALNVGVHRECRHGHQYFLEVTFTEQRTDDVDQAVASLVLPRLHGRELGGELDPPTGEVLVNWIHERLQGSWLGRRVVAVALQETPKNRFVSAFTEARYV